MEPTFELHLSPSAEDWAVLAGGQASPWLRARLLEVLATDEEAAARWSELADPDYQEAIAAAGAVLHAPPELAVVRNLDSEPRHAPPPLPLAEQPRGRIARVRIRPDTTPLWGGIVLLALSVLVRTLSWQLLIFGAFSLLCYAADFHASRPLEQIRRAIKEGDQPLAEALADYFGLRATG